NDEILPRELLEEATSFRRQCIGLNPPKKVWIHITGTDLIRHSDGKMYVLEDNLRCPSRVSYVLQNRLLMKRSCPQFFSASRVRPVVDYPSNLLRTLQSLSPDKAQPTIVVLTPGVFNSAYYEYSFL